MPATRATSVRDRLANAAAAPRYLWGADASVCLDDLSTGTSLDGRLGELRDRSVLIATREQLPAALALVELDGIARRMIICTPDLSPEHLAEIAAIASVDAIVSDDDLPGMEALGVSLRVRVSPNIVQATVPEDRECATEWVLMTSGTTGAPKLASHTLETLTAPINAAPHQQGNVVWGTFYDIRRYGGLQILLRAVLGRGLVRAVECRRVAGRFSWQARGARRHTPIGYAVALAARADESARERARAEVRQAVR